MPSSEGVEASSIGFSNIIAERHLAALASVLLLAIATLFATGAIALSAQTESAAPCQPVTDVSLAYTPTLVHPGTPVQFTTEVITGSLPITYTWDLGDGTAPITGTAAVPVFTISHEYTTTGAFSATLSVWNTCTVPPLTTTVQVTVTARPCVTLTGLALTVAPTQVYTYTPALFTGEVVTGSLPATYTWDFGDGTPPLTGTSPSPILTATHTFTKAQVYTVTLSAWNTCTITPTQQAITLSVGPCEGISDLSVTVWPTAARVGQVITFTANVTGGSPPLALAWSFGDGLTATGAVVTHSYTAPLTYTLTLTAWNPCNQRTTTATVVIAPVFWTFLPLVFQGYDPPTAAHLGYGANIASADHVVDLTVMDFDWAKGFVSWQDAGAGPVYNWVNVDNQLAQFVPRVRHVLLRINGPTPPGVGNPPVSPHDLSAFQDLTLALAEHVSDTWRIQGLETIAYEIWNEPNLDYEWGWQPPNPTQYTALLKKGYLGIKAGDPRAIVVTAGLATTGDSAQDLDSARQLYGAIEVVGDLAFLRGMYDGGAMGYFDALGSHPYGGSYTPETPRDQVIIPVYFRRAEEQHQVMLDHDDDSPIWATEFGWVVETECDLGEHEWMEVSEAQQAEYLAGAYDYADEQWPWMGPMFLFNLDFGTVVWYAECDPMRWYSITYRQTLNPPSPILRRQAFYTLRDMPKHSAW